MRHYTFDNNRLHKLFVEIVGQLGSPRAQEDIIGNILGEVCGHFRFGCGLIYEADHTGLMRLKEKRLIYHDAEIPESLAPEDLFTPDDLEALRDTDFHIRVSSDGQSSKAGEFFRRPSLALVPVFNNEPGRTRARLQGAAITARPLRPGQSGESNPEVSWKNVLAGLVVMADRRGKIILDEESVEAARMVLTLVANHVRLRLAQNEIERTRDFLSGLMDNIGVDIYVNDIESHEVLYSNASMAKPYGGPAALVGRRCWEALYDDKDGECDFCPRPKLMHADGRIRPPHTWDYQRPFDGSWFRVVSLAFPWLDGRLSLVTSSVNITENKLNEIIIDRMAHTDALTGLPNRRRFLQHYEQALIDIGDLEIWLIYFDLDGFKGINDTLGHQAGDDLLKGIGRQALSSPATRGHCYRLGGDEFVLLYRGINRGQVLEVVDTVLARFEEPWTVLRDRSVVCKASLGVARYSGAEGQSGQEVLHRADMIMYEAKRLGKGMAVFHDGTTHRYKPKP